MGAVAEIRVGKINLSPFLYTHPVKPAVKSVVDDLGGVVLRLLSCLKQPAIARGISKQISQHRMRLRT